MRLISRDSRRDRLEIENEAPRCSRPGLLRREGRKISSSFLPFTAIPGAGEAHATRPTSGRNYLANSAHTRAHYRVLFTLGAFNWYSLVRVSLLRGTISIITKENKKHRQHPAAHCVPRGDPIVVARERTVRATGYDRLRILPNGHEAVATDVLIDRRTMVARSVSFLLPYIHACPLPIDARSLHFSF